MAKWNDNFYFDPQSKVLFGKDPNGVFVPLYMDVDESTGNAKIISRIQLYKDLFEFANYARRYPDKRTGKKKSMPLFPYQWSCIIAIINALMEPKSQQYLLALARQAGKSTMFEIVIPFALTFISKYIETESLRFTVVLGSYKDDAVMEIFKKVKPFIYTAIEFYNKKNKDKLLCKHFDSRLSLKDNDDLIEIDKQFPNGDIIPYSQIRNITCGAVNDGYSSNLSCIDEAGLVSADLFKTSMANFTSSTAGVTVYSGVPCERTDSLFYDKKRDKAVKVLLYDYPLVLEMKYLISKSLGDKYKADYISKVSGSSGGEKSSFIRWNYYLDTEDSNGKFTTRPILNNNGILANDIRVPVTGDDNKYVVAGIDVSASGDYKPMIIGETTVREIYNNETGLFSKKYYSEVCDMVTFNKLGQMQSGKEFAKGCALKCLEYKIDCVAIDSSSAGGKIFTQLFREELKKLKCDVMILPFSYNQNKQYLFGYLETCLYNGNIHLLKENANWESAQLVDEMCYMLRTHVKGSTYIKYEAPKGTGYTDDHVNALALFNICIKEISERSMDKRKRIVDDGSGNPWRLYLNKFSFYENVEKNVTNNDKISISLWTVPL